MEDACSPRDPSRTSPRPKASRGPISRACSCTSSGRARGRGPRRRRLPADAAAAARVHGVGLASGIRVVLARETGAYFNSSIAYVYASVFLLLAHGIFMNGFFLESVVDMAPYFRTLPFLL